MIVDHASLLQADAPGRLASQRLIVRDDHERGLRGAVLMSRIRARSPGRGGIDLSGRFLGQHDWLARAQGAGQS